MESISVGSIVQLKTGGPNMTVKSYGTKLEAKTWIAVNVEDNQQVNCQWFDKNGDLQEEIFPVASLNLM